MYVKGTFSKKIFYNNDSGFTVGLLKLKETDCEELKDNINKNLTITGFFPQINEEDLYICYGDIVEHHKYGKQFESTSYERVKPDDKEKIVEYLSSDLFPGIGKKIATKIVDQLGEEAIDIILTDKNCLIEKVKLPIKKADNIYENLLKYEESHKVIVYLTEMGFNTKEALKIYNYFGVNTISNIEHNIYSIIDVISGMSFIKIDRLAKNLKIDEYNDSRIMAGIIYVMQNLLFITGDTYLEYDDIKRETDRLLSIFINDEDFYSYLSNLELELKIIIEDNKYYLFDYYEAENYVIDFLKNLNNKFPYKYKEFNKIIKTCEKENKIIYNNEQKEAIINALNNHITIITGGPGTGKTTLIKAIVDLYKKLYKLNDEDLTNDIALLAPTGRASKRLSETTNFKAMTIHRFLKWNKELDQFLINEYNKDDRKLIIIDEVSMIDLLLFANLLKGISSNVRLVLIGDFNQLPSILSGQVLKDIIESDKFKVVFLSILYRQAEDSYVYNLANEIKNGNILEEMFYKYQDYNFLECSPIKIVESLIMISEKIIAKGYSYKQFQVLAPIYRGRNGIDNLNKELQKIYNPSDESKVEFKFGDVIYRENDKVIGLVNIPDENIYNGDIGIITKIKLEKTSESGKKEIYVDFDGNIIKYFPSNFNDLKHAYVISIHKSQGSEFDMVVIPMCPSYNRMLYRRLIYTGITRVKKKLFVIGDKLSYISSIENNLDYSRKSNLKIKLMNNL